MKRVLSVILVVGLLLSAMPGFVLQAEAAQADIAATVEDQIRAFAASIDQTDADDKAAQALALRGITGSGKTFKVGNDHPLTATLVNSNMYQQALIESCISAITTMQQTDLATLPYASGYMVWVDNDLHYRMQTRTEAVMDSEYRDWALAEYVTYKGKTNAYDSSLIWMAGTTDVLLKVERTKVTATEAVYHVTVTTVDRFDFDTSSNSGFKNLISGMAALFFKEFDWEATASFDLKVPYSCTHSSGAYHWSYDPERKIMLSDSGAGYVENDFIQHSYSNSVGDTAYYYEAAETIRLYHDKPWVLEYDVKNAQQISFAPFENTVSRTIPGLVQSYYNSLFFVSGDCNRPGLSEYKAHSYYGTQIGDLYDFDKNQVYTYRLQNKLLSDGKNMIYLTILNADTGEVLVDQVPMDGYYRGENGKIVLDSAFSGWMNGKDWYINFIGNGVYWFGADLFELRIWENGEGGESESLCTSEVTKPTCTAEGCTTYTCTACGYSYTDSIAALGHQPGEPVRENIKGSSYEEVTCCVTCGEELSRTYVKVYVPGDINGDGEVNNKDATRLFQYLSGWDMEVEEAALNVNGDGSINNKDATRLFQYLSGWDVEIF